MSRSKLDNGELANTRKPIGYIVTNRRTGEQRTFKTLARAMRFKDLTDNAYGGYITSHHAIYPNGE